MAKAKELIDAAKEKNAIRTEDEKVFYWRVMDLRLRKWYLRQYSNRDRL